MTSQLQILNKILQTKDFSMVTLNNLDENYFFTYKAEFNYIKKHYETYRIVPDRLTFVNVFPDFDLQDVNEPDTFLLEQLFNEYKVSNMVTNFNNVKKYLESGQIDTAFDFYTKSMEDMYQSKSMTCTNILTDTSRYDRYEERITDRDKYYISTGFPELDTVMGGIDRENENMVIAARTGIGKSWTLLLMAAAASKQGLTVGIYSGEMSVDKVGYRLDTLLGNIDNKAITRGDLYIKNVYKNYITRLSASGYGAIKVITPNDIAGPATVDALRAFVEREHIQILFIDQYSLLEDTSKAKALFEKVGNISKAVKNLQVMKKIPIISVCQMNRTKNEDKDGNNVQDTTQIGLADRIGQDATSIIMLSRKEESLIVNVVKARDGGDNTQLEYKANFNTGKFVYIPNEKDAISSETDFESMRNSYSNEYSSEEDTFA